MKEDFLSFSEKVISAEEGRELEKEAIKEGCSEEAFMNRAALGAFQKIEEALRKRKEKRVYFLLGKGNNGGDGFTVASLCIEKKIEVVAYSPFSLREISPLSQKKRKVFEEKGGKVCSLEKEPLFPKKGS